MKYNFFGVCALSTLMGLFIFTPCQAQSSEQTEIKMTVGDTVITAVLNNSLTSQDFIAKLPLTLSMQNWDEREYYGKIGELSTQAKKQDDYANGDICYYIPGGSYAVFYAKGDISNISNIIVMGKVNSDLSAFYDLDKNIEVKIEKVR